MYNDDKTRVSDPEHLHSNWEGKDSHTYSGLKFITCWETFLISYRSIAKYMPTMFCAQCRVALIKAQMPVSVTFSFTWLVHAIAVESLISHIKKYFHRALMDC